MDLARLTVLATLTGCTHVAGTSSIDLSAVVVPPGYTISVFTDHVPGARSLALGARGTLFVGTRDRGRGQVYAVVDRDHIYTIARGLNQPNGVAFHDGALYVAEIHRIIRFDDIESHLDAPPAPVVVNDSFPRETRHGWKYVRFGPDGWLYVPIGMPCNLCTSDDPRFGTIMRLRPDGTDVQIFASGIRNTVGFDFHPETGELWFTDNGHDTLGNVAPPDELNRAPRPGMHFGSPYCHGNLQDANLATHTCAEFTAPEFELEPHAAALGMRFYGPNDILIAEHGSAYRTEPVGYRISIVHLQNDRAVSYEPFATGFLRNGRSFARPVDILLLPDGDILFSDDRKGVLYRISRR